MRRLALVILAALAIGGCGKSNIVAVKRPVLPMNICRNIHDEGYDPCPGQFDVSRLIGLHLPAAQELAQKHGYVVRAVAPLAEHEALTMDLQYDRIDVECDSTAQDCIVIRYVERG